MISHRDAQRLAASAIDFPLSIRDDQALRGHLDACDRCRQDAAALRVTAGDLASLTVRRAPDRVRIAVTAAAAEPHAGRFPAFTLGIPAGLPVGFAALLLVALLAAMLLAALVAGGPKVPFLAEVSSDVTEPAAPSGLVVIELRRLGASVTACVGPTSLSAAGGALWFTCPDGSLWRAKTGGDAATQVGDGVQGVATGPQGVWALGVDHVDEFDAPTGAPLRRLSGVGGSAAAADGTTLAVVDATAGVVRWLDTSSATPSVVATTSVGPRPAGIALAFASAWVTEPGEGKVVRIDAVTHRITAEIAVGQEPWSIVAGGDRVWLADDGDGTVASIDPATNDAVLVDVDRTADTSLLPGITIAADGGVWVADSHRSELFRIDPAGGPRAEAAVALTGPLGQIVAVDGSLWVVDKGGKEHREDNPNHGAIVELVLVAAGR